MIALLLLLASPAFASWHYNISSGLGIYQPEGWSARDDGRATRIAGPANDSRQSTLFLGSDWQSRVKTPADLERYVRTEFGPPVPITVSDLPGFRVGSEEHGAFYVLRIPENVIVVEYDLRGSRAQVEEGLTMIGSIDIRTRETP